LVVLAILFFGYYFYKNDSAQGKDKTTDILKTENRDFGTRPKMDLDEVVGKVKNDYKSDPAFQECIAMDMGIQSCLRETIQRRVQKEDNVKFCDDLISGADSCRENYYTKKAEKSMDASVCDNLKNKNNCLKRAYTKKAIAENNEKVCDALTEDYSKQSCRRDVIRRIAIKTNNPALCDKLVVKRSEWEGENKMEYADKMDVDICKEEVKMEMEMRQQEEKMRKEMEAEEKRMREDNLENI